MRTSELLLTFLLNAWWQIALLAAVALLGDWFLKRTVVRYRHFLWVAALLLAISLPALTSLWTLRGSAAVDPLPQKILLQPLPTIDITQSDIQPIVSHNPSILHVNAMVAYGLLAVYVLFLFYRSVKLFRAWARTRTERRDARSIELAGEIQTIVANCERAFGVTGTRMVSSASLLAPATVGIFRPLIILPEELLCAADVDALTAAIGHELVHVARHDYLLNLIYELIFLPLSFHPAAALMRRRIMQTRELRCDELVAERLLDPQVYARSLVRLARSATTLNRRARTVTVGIADADILEVRIMSLLKRTKLNAGRKRHWLIAAAVLLAIPCAAAAFFTLHLNIDPAHAQEPSSATQEKREVRTREDRERFEQEMKARAEREDQELRAQIEKETNPKIKAGLEIRLRKLQEERAQAGHMNEGLGYVFMTREGAAREREQEGKQRAELARLANISMDRAIQIATSQNPGKVIECSLMGERWEESGESTKPKLVLYHVVILTGDESKPTAVHVLVNASDGTIYKVEKEERRKHEGSAFTRSRAEDGAINAGKPKDNAISVPEPEYPAVAKAAHASGEVTVVVTIDENGDVIAARAVAGHPLLQAAAVTAARQAKFKPTFLNNEPVKVKATLVYNFVAQ